MSDCKIAAHTSYMCEHGTKCCVMAHDCVRCGTEHDRRDGCTDTDQLMWYDQDMRAIYPLYNPEQYDQ